MSSSGFYRDLLTENPAMLAEMIAFNRQAYDEMSSLSEAWASKVGAHPSLMKAFGARARGARSPQSEEGYWSFVNPAERLVLLPPADLERLGKMTAAALLAERLSTSVMQSEVRAVKAFLGDDIYHWALFRGRFLPGSLAKDIRPMLPDRQLIPQLVLLSRGVLESVRAGWPEALQAKSASLFAALPLPLTAPVAEDDALGRRLWYLMKKIILQEFDKKWTPFFN